MKKIASLFSVLILCTALAGCAGKPENTTAQTAAPVSYENAKVSYLGPEGTYTQEACETFFGIQGEYIPYKTVNNAVQALACGESDYAVIPQENTIGGAVTDYIDTLIGQTGVSVAGEVELPINQNLLVLPGTELGEIKTVYSHKQGIAQGKEWLSENLPGAEVIEVSSTAEGAKMVSEGSDKSCAAIASASCARVYGLDVLAAAIQNNDRNKTRFYVLSPDEPSTAASDRLAFIASGAASELTSLLTGMKELKMTLVALHDRPLKTELGQYSYVIECADSSYESYLKLAGKCSFDFRYLGSFTVR
ncbi:MAG: hypothetical protein IK093_19460 [Ruminiclostridium sp.]|nr:hypothetical protein [Ruminiclostridium sp.]